MTSLFTRLQRLHEQATPGPWQRIFNRVPAKNFTTGEQQGTCPDRHSFRVVDAANRLLLRVEADPEQVLTPGDADLIAELRSAWPAVADALQAACDLADNAAPGRVVAAGSPIGRCRAALDVLFSEPQP